MMKVTDYLRLPYRRLITPDEAGGYTASIQEFPGCFAEGESAQEAFDNLERAAESWIEGVLESGQAVPTPLAQNRYSGKFALRLPKSVHREAAELAQVEGVSVNQLLVTAISEYVVAQRVGSAITTRLYAGFREAPTRPSEVIRLGLQDVLMAVPEEDQRGPLQMLTSGAKVNA